MDLRQRILNEVLKKGVIRTADIFESANVSRQAVIYHLRKLVAEKKLIKLNSTRDAKYIPYEKTLAASARTITAKVEKRYATKGLKEDEVFRYIELRINLKRLLTQPAYKNVSYAFTEMLNNAIDHSKAEYVDFVFEVKDGMVEFEITDKGIGVYESIRKKFGFKDHFEAVEHLLKGKQTTAPKKHSGQGIFFTSKIADRFLLESSSIKLSIDNKLKDVLMKDVRNFHGTKVTFMIHRQSRKDLKKLFDEYSENKYEFDKTKIKVKLSTQIDGNVSRSEAKRLLYGLDKFKRIILDFNQVKEIGQGFADEIFRVYKIAHPDIQIEPINVSPSVAFMIKRAGSA